MMNLRRLRNLLLARPGLVTSVLGATGVLFIVVGALSGRWMVSLAGITAVGLALGFAIPKAAWPAYIACTFLTGVSVNVAGISFRPELLAVPLMAAGLWRLSQSKPRGHIPPLVIVSASVWLTLTLISSLVFALEPARSVWIWIQEFLGVVVFLLIARSIADKGQLAMTGLKMAGSVVGGFIVLYLVWPLSQSGVDPTDVRLSGLSFEPNLLAAHCLSWLAISFYWRRYRTRSSLFYEALLIVALLLSGTRAAWVGGLVLLAFVAVDLMRSRGWSNRRMTIAGVGSLALGLACVAAAVLLLGSSSKLLNRIVTLVDFSRGTGAYRLEIYGWALEDFSEPMRWLIGTGANSFSQFHPVDPTNVGPAYLSTVWLSMPYDAGVIGGVAFFIAIGAIWWTASRRVDAIPLVAGIAICASATNSFWMAFPWVALALVVDRPRAAREMSRG